MTTETLLRRLSAEQFVDDIGESDHGPLTESFSTRGVSDMDLVVNNFQEESLGLGYFANSSGSSASAATAAALAMAESLAAGPNTHNSSRSSNATSSRNNSVGSRGSVSSPAGSLLVPRSFVCEFCGRRFNQKHHLRHHKYTHTGERPYFCPFCDQTFTQTSSRNKHIKTIHPVDMLRHNRGSPVASNRASS